MTHLRWTLFLLAACGGLGNPGEGNSGITTATPSWTTGVATDPGSGTDIGGSNPTTSGASASGSTSGDAPAGSTGDASTGDASTSTSTGTSATSGPPETPHPKLDLPPSMSTSGFGDTDKDKDKDKDKDSET